MIQPVYPNRRSFVQALAASIVAGNSARGDTAPVSLFDGKTLDGWIQLENNATSLSSGGIADPAAFALRLVNGSDPVSAYLRGRLQDSLKPNVDDYAGPDSKAAISALVKALNQVISGESIYDAARFRGVVLRAETQQAIQHSSPGQQFARLNKLLLEDSYPRDLVKSSLTGWTVKDGAMASNGTGRGVIYTANDYGRFRLMFTMRHVAGNPDHQACVLIFCSRPQPGEKALDALGGIQFQVPNGGHWDYRPGKNNDGGQEFTRIVNPHFDPHQWSRVEILADAAHGTARIAVAQPVGSKAVEVLTFKDPAAGKPGPIAWQMHNGGLFDEYKDISIEPGPKIDDLVSVR